MKLKRVMKIKVNSSENLVKDKFLKTKPKNLAN